MDTSTLATLLPSPFRLDGKVALVTGGTRGIGLAASRALASAGARVAVCARDADACAGVVEGLDAAGAEALAVPANVARGDEAAAAVAAAAERWGRIDIVVNNAGTSSFEATTDASDKVFDRTFAVNVRAPIVIVREALAAGLGAGGSVINVASIAGIRAEAFMGTYGASKAALISATRTMARELGPRGVRVNAIAPGVIRTDFSRLLTETPELHDRVVATTALGRVGEADEVSGAVLYLASDAASYVTGSVLVVDGGLTP